MAKSDELVKYITQRVVTYMDTPKEVRQQAKASLKQQREPWQTRWFGMIPFATRMFFGSVKLPNKPKKPKT
ncbi:YqzE family protein [Paenibacillus whitsoniae]|uniref:YqzE family protein n=1 Tax=Paenibacillus whitsoniae TaxID=2496558 RepID=A0A430JH87_9BACL|nr:YqzE family protein [Paenibacillus whitsoniae]RTE10360.1 YqzE family protein [Paenibacillus whitsoniae]